MNMDWLFEPFRHEFMQRALFGCALLVAFGTQIISNSSRIKEDTALGLLFACSFSLGLV
jgi:ABC-type Mn2+/Zn2+ transport system permease subunit